MKFHKFVPIAAIAFLLLLPTVGAHGSQAVNSSFRTWDGASAELGLRGNLFEPRFTARLKLNDKIQVLAFGRTGASPRDYSYRMTSVNAAYGGFTQGFTVDQKWSGTAWAAVPQLDPISRPIGTFDFMRMENGRPVKAEAKLFANCDISSRETGVVQRKKCSQRDVKRFGGHAIMKLMSTNSVGGVRGTDLVIQSKGLSFSQLMRVVRSMEKVN